MSRDAKKRLARAKATGLRTPNFVRRGLEAADALDARAAGGGTFVEKMRTLAANIRQEMAQCRHR